MTKTRDTHFSYTGFDRYPSRCRLRTYEPTEAGKRDNEPSVIVLTQDLDAPDKGTSLTNAAEDIANAVWNHLDCWGANLVWVQHYPARAFHHGGMRLAPHNCRESFSLVTFEWDHDGSLCRPRWTQLPRRAVEALVSDTL